MVTSECRTPPDDFMLMYFSEFLVVTQDTLNGDLVHLSSVLDDLEELGDIMGEMLQNQEEVEVP